MPSAAIAPWQLDLESFAFSKLQELAAGHWISPKRHPKNNQSKGCWPKKMLKTWQISLVNIISQFCSERLVDSRCCLWKSCTTCYLWNSIKMGYCPYQLVQDFFHQQHHGISGDLSTLTCTCATHIAKDGFLSTFPTARSQQAVQWPTCSAGAGPGLAATKTHS